MSSIKELNFWEVITLWKFDFYQMKKTYKYHVKELKLP